MEIGIIGYGLFGKAMESLLVKNGHTPQCVDVDEVFTGKIDVVFLTVPVQYMRNALEKHEEMFSDEITVVNCSKGIEKETGLLPHQITTSVCKKNIKYVAVSGPSFANEIINGVPTTVSVAGEDVGVVSDLVKLLSCPHFVLEELGTVLELELAGACKNIYAVVSGYVLGSGGGKNTHAHVQVVALREFTKLINAMEHNTEVVSPGVTGDLILTCGSSESRNYQYGYALSQNDVIGDMTAEGAHSAESVAILAKKHQVSLPLATAVLALVDRKEGANDLLYKALGFSKI